MQGMVVYGQCECEDGGKWKKKAVSKSKVSKLMDGATE